MTIDDVRVETEKRNAELAAEGGIDAEELYNKLLTRYVERWGGISGREFWRAR